MPYKKTDTPFMEMSRLLKGYGLNATELSKVLGVSVPTARAKLESPEKITLKDIGLVMRYGHIPVDAIRMAIKES